MSSAASLDKLARMLVREQDEEVQEAEVYQHEEISRLNAMLRSTGTVLETNPYIEACYDCFDKRIQLNKKEATWER